MQTRKLIVTDRVEVGGNLIVRLALATDPEGLTMNAGLVRAPGTRVFDDVSDPDAAELVVGSFVYSALTLA
jgi:hypothetical protein